MHTGALAGRFGRHVKPGRAYSFVAYLSRLTNTKHPFGDDAQAWGVDPFGTIVSRGITGIIRQYTAYALNTMH